MFVYPLRSGTHNRFPAPPTSPQPPKFVGIGTAVEDGANLTLATPFGTAGDLLVAIIGGNNTIPAGATPGDWQLILNPAVGPAVALYAKIAEAADPANWTWALGAGISVSEGVILEYSTAGPLIGGADNGNLNTVPVQAPSAQQWKSSSLMLEAWVYFGNSAGNAWKITTNVNSPTIRANIHTANGGLFIVEYLVPAFGPSTGDTAGGISANIKGALSQGIG